jgi:hypothetical protein
LRKLDDAAAAGWISFALAILSDESGARRGIFIDRHFRRIEAHPWNIGSSDDLA